MSSGRPTWNRARGRAEGDTLRVGKRDLPGERVLKAVADTGALAVTGLGRVLDYGCFAGETLAHESLSPGEAPLPVVVHPPPHVAAWLDDCVFTGPPERSAADMGGESVFVNDTLQSDEVRLFLRTFVK